MSFNTKNHWLASGFLALSILLTGCGGSSSSSDSGDANTDSTSDSTTETSSSTLSGTAATGAAIDGFVYVVDALGTQVNVAIEDDGSFSVTVDGMTAPFLLFADPSNGEDDQYSYAEEADVTVNITPMTTLAMFLANNEQSLADLASGWSSSASSFSVDNLEEIQAAVNANFYSLFSGQGLDGSTYDFFSDAFSADGSGFDALLDSLEIDIDQDGSTFSISVNGSNFSYNSEIDTSNIEIGGGTVTVDGGDGNWDLVISGNVTQNFAGSNMTTAIPETTITGVEGTPEVSDVESAFNNAYTDANDVNVTLLVDTASQKKFQVDATVTATSGGVTVNMQYELIYDYTLN